MSLISDSIASVPFLFAFALEYLPFLIHVSLLYGLSILILASQFQFLNFSISITLSDIFYQHHFGSV
jgi:hypothetical protein